MPQAATLTGQPVAVQISKAVRRRHPEWGEDDRLAAHRALGTRLKAGSASLVDRHSGTHARARPSRLRNGHS